MCHHLLLTSLQEYEKQENKQLTFCSLTALPNGLCQHCRQGALGDMKYMSIYLKFT